MSTLIPTEELHEITATSNNDSAGAADDTDIRHVTPYDKHYVNVWLWEPNLRTGHVLTEDGVTQIAYHQYHAGKNTYLDNFLNPLWQALTERLPMTMAPNLVTTLGGCHCIVSYIITWIVTAQNGPTAPPPVWLLLLNGYCIAVYYTLDCMDGKQARRTQSSSPLGQLFDHGIDCICLLGHLSSVQTWLQMTSVRAASASGSPNVYYYFLMQTTLQTSFFVAQWEEYYTSVLPHATGQVGVTEVNYGLAFVSLLNAGLLWMQQTTSDETTEWTSIYSTKVWPYLPATLKDGWLHQSRVRDVLLEPTLGMSLEDLQLRHVLSCGWYVMVSTLVVLSITRVTKYILRKRRAVRQQNPTKEKPKYIVYGTPSVLGAFSKLISPLLASVSIFCLPRSLLLKEQQLLSLCLGLVYILITIKIIVFSMARQAYAAIQVDVLVPWCVVLLWILKDPRWSGQGIHLLLQVTAVWYLYRLYQWTTVAIHQICQRLNIQLFRIKNPAVEENKTKTA